MPAFRDRVNAAQAQDLAAYIRAFGPPNIPTVQPGASDFERRFRQLQEEWETLHKQLQEVKSGAERQ
jgi:hypothetical protein